MLNPTFDGGQLWKTLHYTCLRFQQNSFALVNKRHASNNLGKLLPLQPEVNSTECFGF